VPVLGRETSGRLGHWKRGDVDPVTARSTWMRNELHYKGGLTGAIKVAHWRIVRHERPGFTAAVRQRPCAPRFRTND